LKFGDIVTAVASLAVVFILVDSVLGIALIPMNSAWGLDVTSIVSFLVSALVVGYVFAGKIREESRMISIGKVVVLFAVVIFFAARISYGAIGHYSALVDENLRNMYSTNSWTNTDWFAHEAMALHLLNAVPVVYALAFGFIGLYLGSMRKPSAKTKE
jgi:ABC-type transport system involved in multi-copper enzyme maturation permease subunit